MGRAAQRRRSKADARKIEAKGRRAEEIERARGLKSAAIKTTKAQKILLKLTSRFEQITPSLKRTA